MSLPALSRPSRRRNASKSYDWMTVERIRLRIATPIEPVMPGRGFYQLEEDALYVQVGLFSSGRRFYSFLESSNVLFDFDRLGRLIFMEVRVPRRRWEVDTTLEVPAIVQPADIRWLNFRDTIDHPAGRCPQQPGFDLG